VRGCLFNMRENWKQYLLDMKNRGSAMSLLSRIMASWMAGSVRGCFFNMRENFRSEMLVIKCNNETATQLSSLLRVIALFESFVKQSMARCVARWQVRHTHDYLGLQAAAYHLSVKVSEDQKFNAENTSPDATNTILAPPTHITLARSVVVEHIYSRWDASPTKFPKKLHEGKTAVPLTIDWNEAVMTLRKVALLEDIFREKIQSDEMFEEVAMSGMKFLNMLIESWEPLYAEGDFDGFDDIDRPHTHMFNFKSEGAFFFMDVKRLRQLRDDLRAGRIQSDMSVLESHTDEDDEEED